MLRSQLIPFAQKEIVVNQPAPKDSDDRVKPEPEASIVGVKRRHSSDSSGKPALSSCPTSNIACPNPIHDPNYNLLLLDHDHVHTLPTVSSSNTSPPCNKLSRLSSHPDLVNGAVNVDSNSPDSGEGSSLGISFGFVQANFQDMIFDGDNTPSNNNSQAPHLVCFEDVLLDLHPGDPDFSLQN